MQLPSAIAFGIVQFGHHVRKIERRDRRHDAERKSLDAALDAAAHLEHFAGRDLRQRAGELRQLGGLEHLGARLAGDLAVLFGDERRQLVDVLLEQRLVAIEDLHALLDRRRATTQGTPRARPNRRVDFLALSDSGTREMTSPLARIVDVEGREVVHRRTIR